MQKAAKQFYDDYLNDKELISLTELDCEHLINEECVNLACGLPEISLCDVNNY
jgi:hypothetical protein